MGSSIRRFVTFVARGQLAWHPRCDRSISPTRSCLSTIRDTPWRSSTGSTSEVKNSSDFCRSDGRLELYLCGSDLHTKTARLDRFARSCIQLLRRHYQQVVQDNLKSGVTKACLYESTINRTNADFASRYNTAICPAPPRRPRNKAKVEVGVQVVGRWILARLPNKRFFSLAELNTDVRTVLDDLNRRPLRGWGRSRRDLFEELDRPVLIPL
jgi:hypothetical protein